MPDSSTPGAHGRSATGKSPVVHLVTLDQRPLSVLKYVAQLSRDSILSAKFPHFSARFMSLSNPLAVGIDLGTTFSVVACLDDLGRPQTLHQRRRRQDHAQRACCSKATTWSSARKPSRRWPPTATAWPNVPSAIWAIACSTRCSAAGSIRPRRSQAWILQQAAHRRSQRRSARFEQSRHHRAGLLRRSSPQSDARRRLHGRLRSDGHHQRADRRRGGLRLPARLSRSRRHRGEKRKRFWFTTWAAARST